MDLRDACGIFIATRCAFNVSSQPCAHVFEPCSPASGHDLGNYSITTENGSPGVGLEVLEPGASLGPLWRDVRKPESHPPTTTEWLQPGLPTMTFWTFKPSDICSQEQERVAILVYGMCSCWYRRDNFGPEQGESVRSIFIAPVQRWPTLNLRNPLKEQTDLQDGPGTGQLWQNPATSNGDNRANVNETFQSENDFHILFIRTKSQLNSISITLLGLGWG